MSNLSSKKTIKGHMTLGNHVVSVNLPKDCAVLVALQHHWSLTDLNDLIKS